MNEIFDGFNWIYVLISKEVATINVAKNITSVNSNVHTLNVQR